MDQQPTSSMRLNKRSPPSPSNVRLTPIQYKAISSHTPVVAVRAGVVDVCVENELGSTSIESPLVMQIAGGSLFVLRCPEKRLDRFASS